MKARRAVTLAGAALFGTSATLLVSTAHAQVANATGVSEVIVTAEKRESTVQKTPLSVTAISAQEIAVRGVTDFDKLAQGVPGIAEHTSGPGQTEFELRGLSSSGGAAPTVGFYLDETPLTAAAFTQNGKVVIDPNVYDMSRVEVLRGPQGTLYGAGSMGGTIKLVTNAPNLEQFEASGEVMVSGTDGSNGPNHKENAMVNIPVIAGQLAVRLVGSYSYDNGWIDRIVTGVDNSTSWLQPNGATRYNVLSTPPTQIYRDVNSTTGESFRATVAWTPTSNLTLTPMFMYEKGSQDGYSAYDSTPGTLAHYQPFNAPESISDTFTLESLDAVYNAKGFDLTSATGYWQRKENQYEDASEALAATFGISPYVDQGGIGKSINNELDTSSQFSEEVRAASNGSSRFSWLIGAFYSDFRSTFDLTEPTPGLEPDPDGANLITIDEPITIKQYAVFGEASYKILDTLKFTVGLRWYDFDTTATSFQNGFLFEGTTLYNQTVSMAVKNNGTNPKFNLSWTPTDNLLVYGTISKGFRQAGVNQPTSTSLGCPVTPLTYNADSVWNYELGEKARLYENRITFNADAYVEEWQNVQSIVFLPCGFSYSTNGPSAQVYGGEAELAAKLIDGATSTEGLSLTANGGYAHAKYTGSDPTINIVSGDPMLNIPEFTFSGGLAYVQNVAMGMTAAARINYNFVGSRQELTLFASPAGPGGLPGYQTLPSYGLTDLRFSLSRDKWTASLFVTNLTDKHAELGFLNINSFNLYSYNRVVTNQPRTIGVDLTARY
jgi:outer membrane receptor protein involved in Fe transport